MEGQVFPRDMSKSIIEISREMFKGIHFAECQQHYLCVSVRLIEIEITTLIMYCMSLMIRLGVMGAKWNELPESVRRSLRDASVRTLSTAIPQGISNAIYG